jgi:hypothetical protein
MEADRVPWLGHVEDVGSRGSTMSARATAPCSPEAAAAADTPDENDDVGESPLVARTLAASERTAIASTDSRVELLAPGRK